MAVITDLQYSGNYRGRSRTIVEADVQSISNMAQKALRSLSVHTNKNKVRFNLVFPTLYKITWYKLYFSSVISSSNICSNEKGSNAIPSPTKCLLIASTQCNLKLCNMALVPSMTTRTAIVRTNHMVKNTTVATTPMPPVMAKALSRVIDQRTIESC